MYKILWRNDGAKTVAEGDKMHFSFSWKYVMQKTPDNNIYVIGPRMTGYQMVRMDKLYVRLMTNNNPQAIVLLPGDQTSGSIMTDVSSLGILSIPGGRLIMPNISSWAQTGPGPLGWQSEPGTKGAGRTFKLSFYSPLHQWNKLTSQIQLDLDWKDHVWFQCLSNVFDESDPRFSPGSWTQNTNHLTFRANLYVTFGQYESGFGATAHGYDQSGASPLNPVDERDDHLISTAVALHKCGATDCVDLTDLDDVKQKSGEPGVAAGSSADFLTPLMAPPINDFDNVTELTVNDDVEVSDDDSCSETDVETEFE